MKKEFRRIRGVSKKIIPRNQYKKIKKISSYSERTEGLKYLVASKLKLRHLELEMESEKISKKEALVIKSNLTLLKSKIKIFETTHSKKDYKVIQKIIKKIEREIKCLTS